MENYNFVLNKSENKGTRIDPSTLDTADPIIKSVERERNAPPKLSEEDVQWLNGFPQALERDRDSFRTFVNRT